MNSEVSGAGEEEVLDLKKNTGYHLPAYQGKGMKYR